ncbi:MAG: hypothetical protein C0474_08100 [Sphingobium sp.]|nr:hypothetical protein [Sphingobium sp.]
MTKIAKVGGGLLATGAAVVTALSSARSSIPKPPDPPAFDKLIEWIISGNDWLALSTAAFGAISAGWSIWQMFQASASTGADVRGDGRKTREGLEHVSGQVAAEGQIVEARDAEKEARDQARHEAQLAATARDKHEQALKDLIEGKASAELVGRYERALGIKRQDGSQVTEREAAQFALAAQAAGESDDPRQREIAALIDQGRIVDAAVRKADLAEEKLGSAQLAAAADLRDAGRLALPVSPSTAMAHFARATELDPHDVWGWIELGRLKSVYARLADARVCFQNALQRVTDERDRGVLHDAFATIVLAEGDLVEGRKELEAAHAIMVRAATDEPNNIARQRDLSVSFNKLGNVEVAAGNLAAARARFEAGLDIRERLAAREPGNTEWQRDLSVSFERLGDVEVAAGNLAAARARFEAGLDIRERLAAQEPGNTGWQRDVFISNAKLAQLAEATGDRAGAIARFTAAEAIMAALASAKPDHPGFARDLTQVRGDLARLRG